MSPACPATAADADEVVRLACVMFVSMGMPEPGDGWRTNVRTQFADRLGTDAMAAVVDDPTEPRRLAASAVVTVSTRLPTPTNPSGRCGYVQWVATDERFRNRGFARAVMTMLLEWLDTNDVAAIELHATAMGEPLYRSLGFWEGEGPPALRRRQWDPPPRS